MAWRLLGVAQGLGALAGLVLWVGLRAMSGNVGSVSFDVLSGGLGMLVIGYSILVLVAAGTLIRGGRPAWVGWVELSLVPALLYVALWSFQDMTAHHGAPAFYGSIIGLAIPGAIVAELAGGRILRKPVTA